MGSAQIISLDIATEGMVLSTALIDSHGNILLPGQTTLTEKMLNSLRRHAIGEISIESHQADNSNELENARRDLEEKIDHINRVFQTHENELINQKFKSYLIKFWSGYHNEKN